MAGFTSRNVRAVELQAGMIIREVTELSFDYASLDEARVKFLHTQFRGAKAVVATEMGHQAVPISDLQPFDNVHAVVDIPETLKIAQVITGIGPKLAEQGLLEFKVAVPLTSGPAPEADRPASTRHHNETLAPGSEAARILSVSKMVEVKRFLDVVEQASTDRARASTAVEEMMDRGRQGDYSTKGVEAVVDEIVRSGSGAAMRAIAGLRGSDQTYAHCTDMSVILSECYTDVMHRQGKAASEVNKRFVLIAGFMHDIGKAEIPREILESSKRFAPESREMQIMRNHATYGARILTEMEMHPVAVNVAHFHHVKKDGTLFTSYPEVAYSEVLPITRLASIVDVYQALIGRRKYKTNWVPGKAIEYIVRLKGAEFDDGMLDHFVESMGRYPVGSLVRLSSGDLAFVLMVAPIAWPDRPIVAVVENAKKELLSHASIVDLMVERDLKVVEVIDHYAHYNATEDQAYRIFQSIRFNG